MTHQHDPALADVGSVAVDGADAGAGRAPDPGAERRPGAVAARRAAAPAEDDGIGLAQQLVELGVDHDAVRLDVEEVGEELDRECGSVLVGDRARGGDERLQLRREVFPRGERHGFGMRPRLERGAIEAQQLRPHLDVLAGPHRGLALDQLDHQGQRVGLALQRGARPRQVGGPDVVGPGQPGVQRLRRRKRPPDAQHELHRRVGRQIRRGLAVGIPQVVDDVLERGGAPSSGLDRQHGLRQLVEGEVALGFQRQSTEALAEIDQRLARGPEVPRRGLAGRDHFGVLQAAGLEPLPEDGAEGVETLPVEALLQRRQQGAREQAALLVAVGVAVPRGGGECLLVDGTGPRPLRGAGPAFPFHVVGAGVDEDQLAAQVLEQLGVQAG